MTKYALSPEDRREIVLRHWAKVHALEEFAQSALQNAKQHRAILREIYGEKGA